MKQLYVLKSMCISVLWNAYLGNVTGSATVLVLDRDLRHCFSISVVYKRNTDTPCFLVLTKHCAMVESPCCVALSL